MASQPFTVGIVAGAAAYAGKSELISSMEQTAKFIFGEARGQLRYAFRVLPDALLSGALLIGVMLGFQPALLTFAGGIVTTGLIQGKMAEMVMASAPQLAKPGGALGGGVDRCSGHFPGVTWSRIFTVLKHPRDLIEGSVPSYYMTVVGYVLSFVLSQSFFFKDELSMRPDQQSGLQWYTALTTLAVVGIGIFRISTDCEQWWSVLLSSLLGLLLGFAFVGLVRYSFGRRPLNILQIPLLEPRLGSDKPIYVCDGPQ